MYKNKLTSMLNYSVMENLNSKSLQFTRCPREQHLWVEKLTENNISSHSSSNIDHLLYTRNNKALITLDMLGRFGVSPKSMEITETNVELKQTDISDISSKQKKCYACFQLVRAFFRTKSGFLTPQGVLSFYMV